MKFFILMILGFSLVSTGLLFSQQPQKRNCTCKDCKCTIQSHCGCYSDKGCNCGTQQSCCGNANCQGH